MASEYVQVSCVCVGLGLEVDEELVVRPSLSRYTSTLVTG